MKLTSTLVAAVLASLAYNSSTIHAATFVWSGTATDTYQWAAGTNWSAAPVSNLDTILNYTSTFAASVVITSNNDVASPPFNLNQLSFTNVGPASGPAPTLTLTGNQLEFITNSTSTTPTLVFNTTGTVKPTVDIQNNLLLTNNLGVTATTDGKLSGAISGGGSLTKSGAGSLTLSGANSYSGTTTVSAGSLVGIGANAFGSTAGISIAGAGTLSLRGDSSTNFVKAIDSSAYTLSTSASGATINVDRATVTGTGAKSMTIGALNTTSVAATYQLNFTGANNTSLSLGAVTGAASTAAGTVTIANGITGGGGLSLASYTSANTTGGETVTFNGAGKTTVTGAITPSTTTLNLTYSGSGSLTLNGTNTYTGTTTISNGVLLLGSATAMPGGIANGGSGVQISFNGGVLGLGFGDFSRSVTNTVGTIGTIRFASNGGFAAYGADRIVNFGGAVTPSLVNWSSGLNGKSLILGAASSANKVTVVNPLTVVGNNNRPVQVVRGTGASVIDGQLSGAITESAGVLGGISVTGNGVLALTGASTFTGNVIINSGTVVVNSLDIAGANSPIGKGTYGVTLNGGTFQYAPVAGVGGAGASVDRNFTICASSSIDASGTGALVFNAPTGNIISPDISGLAFTATGANAVMNLTGNYSGLAVGMTVSGPGITAGTKIASFSSTSTATTITLSANVTSTTGSANFGFATGRTLTLTGTNTATNSLGGILQDSSAAGAGTLGLTKAGAGTWALTNANTYTGPTNVSAGTLLLGASNVLPNASKITIDAATLNAGTFTDTVGTLKVTAAATINLGSGGELAFADSSAEDWTSGTLNIVVGTLSPTSIRFGTSNSGLTGTQLSKIKVNGSGTYALDANGYLTVATGYSSWQSANSTAGTINQDHDADGVSNGVEYFLGGTTLTTGFTALPSVVDSSGVLSITWNKSGTYTGVYNTDFVVETSATLIGTWTTETVGGNVTINGNAVTYTFPGPLGSQGFARLRVTGP